MKNEENQGKIEEKNEMSSGKKIEKNFQLKKNFF